MYEKERGKSKQLLVTESHNCVCGQKVVLCGS